MRPIFKIILAIAVVAVVGLVVYFLVAGGGPEPGSSTDQENKSDATEGTAIGDESTLVKKISDEAVFDFWVNYDTKEVFYFTPDGRVMNAKQGPDLEISNQKVNALNFIEVGPKSQKVIAAFGDPRTPQWGIFDVVDGVWRPLPSEIMNAAWGASDEKLIVVIKSGGEFNLAEADITKSPPSYKIIVRDIRIRDLKITGLPDGRVVLSEAPSASYAGSLWQIDPKTSNVNLLIAPEEGLSLRWTSDKDLGFVFSSDSGLSILENNSRIKAPALLDTLPWKCTADSSNIYCFVPQNIPSDTVLPDDYLMDKFFSIDDLFVLGINSEDSSKMLSSNTGEVSAIDAKNPQVSGEKIYFINRYDNGLYEFGF